MKSVNKIILVLTSLAIALFFAVTSNAAYLQSDGEVQEDRQKEIYRPPPDVYIPPPPKVILPPRYTDYYSFVGSLRVISNSPKGYNGLNIFLIKGRAGYRIQTSDIITLDEAYRRGVIRISESDHGTVSKIWVSNHSASNIFLMAGEIVAGGKQTRTILKNFLVAPYAKNVVVDVYCIEENRWDDRSKVFVPAEPMLDYSMRGKVLREEGQDEIWGGIKAYEAETREYSSTHSLHEVYEKRGRDNRLEREIGNMIARLPYSAVGMVVTRKDKILGIEMFYSREMFRKQFSKLVRSYYYTEVPGWFYSNVNSDGVRRFLRELRSASLYEDSAYNGVGRLYDVSSGSYYGSALDFGGILHLSVINR